MWELLHPLVQVGGQTSLTLPVWMNKGHCVCTLVDSGCENVVLRGSFGDLVVALSTSLHRTCGWRKGGLHLQYLIVALLLGQHNGLGMEDGQMLTLAIVHYQHVSFCSPMCGMMIARHGGHGREWIWEESRVNGEV